MSLTLAAISAVAANTVAPVARTRSRQQTDALATEEEMDRPAGETVLTRAAVRATALAPPAPLAPAVMQALIDLQADVARDLPGLFETANATAGRLYSRRRNLARAT